MALTTRLVLTAANDAQAAGYEAQLRAREQAGQLPGDVTWQVVTDPGGRRVGSGGSTLVVLEEVARDLARQSPKAKSMKDLLRGHRIVVIHSGGDARRLCSYAAQGKVFTPLPCETADQHPATLFDLILASLLVTPAPKEGHLLIAAGDVLLTFDAGEVDFTRPGVTGVAYPGTMDRASKHGVYITDRDGHVVDFLQKPSEDEASAAGAIDAVGRILVDTGLVSVDPATCADWLKMGGVTLKSGKVTASKTGLIGRIRSGDAPALDLYEQWLMALSPKLDRDAYLEAMASAKTANQLDPAARKQLETVHDGLSGTPFTVNVLPYCDFFHVGSSRELLTNLTGLSRTAKQYGFANRHRTALADGVQLNDAFVFNTVIDSPKASLGSGVLLEAVHATEPMTLPGPNVVVGWPGGTKRAVELPSGWGMVCLPIQGGTWATVLFGLDDDFKTSFGAGGTFGNEPMAAALSRMGLEPTAVFGRDFAERTLWDAKLWTVGKLDQAWDRARWMTSPGASPPRGFAGAKRLSLAELIPQVDHDRLISHRREIQRLGELHHLGERLLRDANLYSGAVVESLRSADEAMTVLEQLAAIIEQEADPRVHARMLKLAEQVVEAYPDAGASLPKALGDDPSRGAYEAVARSVEMAVDLPEAVEPAAILHDQVVWVTTPVRLDFAGGWSDTPPICAELGGSVVNAAITLNGQYPVQVMAKLTERPAIVLNSIDLGERLELTETPQILDYTDLADWAALPKAALVLAGLCPRNPRASLKNRLKEFGGGLDLTFFSAVPKGSGLGTSSILGSAVLACLGRVAGKRIPNETLIERTSLLEQIMTSGGGWQDQVGGITPGVKLIRTRPGADQTPSLHWTGLGHGSATPWSDSLLLYFTGQKRLARNILQNVVGRYLARDPDALETIELLKDGAEQMKRDLDVGDFDAFGRGVDEYWQLKKRFDPGATNPKIEAIIKPLEDLLIGKLLPGAGGGGFVFMVAKDDQAAARIRKRLLNHPPNPLARFFEFDIDRVGLSVTVL